MGRFFSQIVELLHGMAWDGVCGGLHFARIEVSYLLTEYGGCNARDDIIRQHLY